MANNAQRQFSINGDGDYPIARQRRQRIGSSKEPPAVPDVEKSLIGSCIVDDLALSELAAILPEEALFDARHRRIYSALVSLFEEGEPIDMVTLTERLRENSDLTAAGGSEYLTECTTAVESARNVEHHARIVQEKWYLRRLVELGKQLHQRGMDTTEDAFDALAFAEQRIFDIAAGSFQGQPEAIGEGLVERTKRITEEDVKNGVTGVPTGFPGLDRMTAGWQDSNLIIIAARPSMGKSGLAVSQVLHAARQGFGVAFFTLEMSTDELRERVLATEAKVDSQNIRRRFLTDDERGRLIGTAEKLSGLPVYIDDTPGLSLTEMKAKARQLKHAHDIGLVVVDYLQLMGGDPSADNREQEVASISRGLKRLAKELGLPVIALAQLNRSLESRNDKRPQLSDLRESGAIEQDADVVAFIYRDEYYGITVDADGNRTEGIAELIIGKQRNGPTGTIELAFVKKFATFKPLARQERNGGDPGF